jgi:hypothetical protein
MVVLTDLPKFIKREFLVLEMTFGSNLIMTKRMPTSCREALHVFPSAKVLPYDKPSSLPRMFGTVSREYLLLTWFLIVG